MTQITAELVKELRSRTGVGMMECKKALSESAGDMDKAVEYLRKQGIAKADSKSGREAGEGLVEAYIHPGSRVGVLIEVNCETDFVARTDEFQRLVRNLAMQVAATRPLAVRREGVPAELVERERVIYAEQLKNEGKPEAMIPRILEGKMDKFYQSVVLMEQPYIRDDKKTVEEIVKEAIAKMGENIRVRRFATFTLGQD
ncbi:MAG TPA: translation elongation factor Ts [Candidatus Eisenbacteria bacterium]|nr:translation elongation factor Ts [Candidatus Eisenbacteria bacterium]